MKNFVILVLLGIIAYLVLTSGWLQRAVQSPGGQPNPSATPRIGVTVYSPYGTGGQTPNAVATQLPPQQPPLTIIVPTSQATGMPDVPIFTPPPPEVVVPAVPPTLAVPNTPTPAANFKISLDTPQDGETTRTSPLPVIGTTTPNAVVSVNDVVGVADGAGHFNLMVPLQAGPNALEIIASEPNGQQAFLIITVMYQP